MKFAAFVILSCLCFYFVSCGSPRTTNWGNVNARTLGVENVNVGSSFGRSKNHTFTYPRGRAMYPIVGIKHVDHKSHPVTVRFVKGGIGFNNVTITIESQRGHGINSNFYFYTY